MDIRAFDFISFKSWGKVRYGIVIDVYGFNMVLHLVGRKLRFTPLPNKVLSTHRNWAYGRSPDKYEMQNNLVHFFYNQGKNFRKILKSVNGKTDPGLLAVYVITSTIIEYPTEFVDSKITAEHMFTNQWGFHAAS